MPLNTSNGGTNGWFTGESQKKKQNIGPLDAVMEQGFPFVSPRITNEKLKQLIEGGTTFYMKKILTKTSSYSFL